MERSIALAYEAVDHFQGKTVHITNELIHNPEVNDKLKDMNVQFIEKVGEGQKNFDSVGEGDVVILPAFGASYEEMDYFDKKVRPGGGESLFVCPSSVVSRDILGWILKKAHFLLSLFDYNLTAECRGCRHYLSLGIQSVEHG